MTTATDGRVRIRLECTDAELREAEREDFVRQLFRELDSADGAFGEVSRVRTQPPPGTKSVFAEVTAVLSIVIGAAGLRPLFDYLAVRHSGREFSVEIEIEGRKVVLRAKTEDEMRLAYQAAVNLITGVR